MGTLYDSGKGLPRDFRLAANWLTKAAEQGHALAQYNLGNLYDAGEGVPRDFGLAAKWYGKAAVQGQPEAEYNLGVCYEAGEGVPQDLVEAYKWVSLAYSHGNRYAARYKESLAKKLTVEQKARAQQLADAILSGPAR